MVGRWRALWLFERRQLAEARAQRLLPAQIFLLMTAMQAFALSRDGGGQAGPVLLAASLAFALLLAHPFILAPDAADGTLALYRSHGVSPEGLALLKMAAVVIGYLLPLLAALPPALLLTGLPLADWGSALAAAALLLLAMTPALTAAATLGLGSRMTAALTPFLALPLLLPPLLAAMAMMRGEGGAGLCLGSALLAWALCPWLAGAALRHYEA